MTSHMFHVFLLKSLYINLKFTYTALGHTKLENNKSLEDFFLLFLSTSYFLLGSIEIHYHMTYVKCIKILNYNHISAKTA